MDGNTYESIFQPHKKEPKYKIINLGFNWGDKDSYGWEYVRVQSLTSAEEAKQIR